MKQHQRLIPLPSGTRVRDRISGRSGIVPLYQTKHRILGLFPVYWPSTGQTTTCGADDVRIVTLPEQVVKESKL